MEYNGLNAQYAQGENDVNRLPLCPLLRSILCMNLRYLAVATLALRARSHVASITQHGAILPDARQPALLAESQLTRLSVPQRNSCASPTTDARGHPKLQRSLHHEVELRFRALLYPRAKSTRNTTSWAK